MSEIYIGAWPVNDYRYYLKHSAKGTTWHKEDHKYIDIIDGVYIYAKDRNKKDPEYDDRIDEYLKDYDDATHPYSIDGANVPKNSKMAREHAKQRIIEEDRKKKEKEEKKKKRQETLSSISPVVKKANRILGLTF